METLGRKIFRQRKIRGFSQEELAELVGVSRQAVSRWEADAAQPTFDNLQILCAVLKVSITYFTNDSSDTDETPPGPVLSGAEAVFFGIGNDSAECETGGRRSFRRNFCIGRRGYAESGKKKKAGASGFACGDYFRWRIIYRKYSYYLFNRFRGLFT